ncbi:type VI secretion system tube protein Hcp [Roseomonas sp. HF4]|uniref:type VI secretion system tube protein Hcp n=1 Tax=Roseomonas sp. HF4 TaxID=2562313 RepID=UPI0010C06203|nr:type VI secretion system tube protein Hcp [Roseomonas sp. HF4]
MAETAIFLSFEGVDGEAAVASGISSAPAGGGWIGLTSCEYGGIANYAQQTASQSEMQTEMHITVTKDTDAASIGLLRQALTGDFKKNVVIVFVRQAAGEALEYQRLELANAGIVGFELAGSADRPSEMYRLHCGEFTISSWSFEGSERRAPAVTNIRNEI